MQLDLKHRTFETKRAFDSLKWVLEHCKLQSDNHLHFCGKIPPYMMSNLALLLTLGYKADSVDPVLKMEWETEEKTHFVTIRFTIPNCVSEFRQYIYCDWYIKPKEESLAA
ncbi:hypothetical protein [Chroococcidiopsis sp.]|uniref:hypothetical protein n=1 Tax=Chroococcidiopsis sp. TaxID=3088168 RepID=UPI003F31F467